MIDSKQNQTEVAVDCLNKSHATRLQKPTLLKMLKLHTKLSVQLHVFV